MHTWWHYRHEENEVVLPTYIFFFLVFWGEKKYLNCFHSTNTIQHRTTNLCNISYSMCSQVKTLANLIFLATRKLSSSFGCSVLWWKLWYFYFFLLAFDHSFSSVLICGFFPPNNVIFASNSDWLPAETAFNLYAPGKYTLKVYAVYKHTFGTLPLKRYIYTNTYSQCP